jgi:hypothetical protein
MRLPRSAMVSLIVKSRFIFWFLSALFPVYVTVILILNPIYELFYYLGIFSLFFSILGLFMTALTHSN